jgi:hypothetical protein
MKEENNLQQTSIEKIDAREQTILNLEELSNEDLMEFYSKIEEQLSYLNNNIIVEEEE